MDSTDRSEQKLRGVVFLWVAVGEVSFNEVPEGKGAE